MSWTKFFKVAGKMLVSGNNAPVAKQSHAPRRIPEMTMDMIQSNNEPITTAQAIKLFKEFAVKSGYLEKDELTEHAGYFADDLKEHGEALKTDAEGNLVSIKEQLRDLKSRLKGETDKETRDNLKEEIECVADDIACEQSSLQTARDALAAFKADKRQFLIEYVNQQTQD